MFQRAKKHVSSQKGNVIGITVGLCIIAGGVGLGYSIQEGQAKQHVVDWVPIRTVISYTYSLQLTGGKTTASFTPNYLVGVSYRYVSADGVSRQGYDNTTISGTQVPPNSVNKITTEEGTIYYDRMRPEVSRVFPLSPANDVMAWVLVGILCVIGSVILAGSII